MFPLVSQTSSAWLPVALESFDEVLIDHAHCEKKAAASAMALVNSYPSYVELVKRCSKLAQEELRHFHAVHKYIVARGVTFTHDHGDPYAKALLTHVRKPLEERLLDRLLVSALIEARSCERLDLLGGGLADPELQAFYKGLATAEAGHYKLFVDLAKRYADASEVDERLAYLAQREGEIVAELPIEPRIH